LKEVVFTEEALDDVGRLERFLKEHLQALEKFREELLKAVEIISISPEGSPRVLGTNYRKNVHFKYIYFYVIYDKVIEIERVFSEKENWINDLN
jgi:plasmid stabilization system protein ParE